MTPDEFKARIKALETDASGSLLRLKRFIAGAVLLYNDLETKPYQDRRDAVSGMVGEYVDVPYISELLEVRAVGCLIDEAFRMTDLNPAISVEGLVEGFDE